MSQRFAEFLSGLPRAEVTADPVLPVDARRVSAWTDALPMANGPAATTQLLDGLARLNRQSSEGAERLAVMEALRRPVLTMIEVLDRQIIGASFPLPAPKVAMAGQLIGLQQGMAVGYRLALREIGGSDGRISFLRAKSAATAATRASFHLAELLCRDYLIYASPAPGTWRDLHKLYAYSDAAGFVGKVVDDPLHKQLQASTAQNYLTALLHAVSNPYRLSQRESVDTFAACRILAQRAIVTPNSGGGANTVAIELDHDEGPGYLPEERVASGGGNLFVDLDPVLAWLNQEVQGRAADVPFAFKGKDVPPVTTTPEALTRMTSSWRPAPERGHRRLAAGHQLDTLVGHTALHHALSGGMDADAIERSFGGEVQRLSETATASWSERYGEPQPPQRHSALVLDQSLGGYRLEWDNVVGARLRVGEVVGLAPAGLADDETDWMVGLVCWMRILPDGRVDAGVALVSRQARAAALSLYTVDQRKSQAHRVIAMRPSKAEDSARELLLSSGIEKGAALYRLVTAPNPYDPTEQAERSRFRSLEVIDNNGVYLHARPSGEETRG